MNRVIPTSRLALALLAALALSFSVHAQAITWGTPQNISADTDVSTTGSLVGAFNLGLSGVSSTTLNGVTFEAFAFPLFSNSITTVSVGNFSFAENSGYLFGRNDLSHANAPFASLSASYKTLLSSAGSADYPTTITLTLSGLTTGKEYLFQWWTNNSSIRLADDATKASATNDVTLDHNTSNTFGSTGQYAVGTFTATGSTQDIMFDGFEEGALPLINAFQLRDVSAVPEPSTYAAIFGAAALGLAAWRRRRRAG